ncbi:hypothetical protein [Pseudonocardia sp. EV170527-09]|uniref:hypothetical protein n=1 Tax=Pseudonocardia sp. EV170527-09 TaxID=2603411 RepID=UPI00195F9C7B|nr:hypothetical protein [Pseudonocardia sp. EV170527-09]
MTEPGGSSLPELIFGPTRRTNDKPARTYSDIRARTRTHAYYNKEQGDARALFWVSPAGRLAHLFDRLHDLTDPAEVVRQSALHDVDFLPPGSVPGAD